jgi:hypothetical protein
MAGFETPTILLRAMAIPLEAMVVLRQLMVLLTLVKLPL